VDKKIRSTSRGWSVLGEPLTDSRMNLIAFDIRNGIAKPEDAKRLLEHFCELVDRGKPVPSRLLEHLREAFQAFLDDAKTLDRALGVKRKKGRPPADEIIRAQMAAEVMRCRLAGKTHEQALITTVQRFGWVESVISEAWAKYRGLGLDRILVERQNLNPKFTDKEKERLRDMLHTMPKLDRCGKISD
jgi:hypothetical protein